MANVITKKRPLPAEVAYGPDSTKRWWLRQMLSAVPTSPAERTFPITQTFLNSLFEKENQLRATNTRLVEQLDTLQERQATTDETLRNSMLQNGSASTVDYLSLNASANTRLLQAQAAEIKSLKQHASILEDKTLVDIEAVEHKINEYMNKLSKPSLDIQPSELNLMRNNLSTLRTQNQSLRTELHNLKQLKQVQDENVELRLKIPNIEGQIKQLVRIIDLTSSDVKEELEIAMRQHSILRYETVQLEKNKNQLGQLQWLRDCIKELQEKNESLRAEGYSIHDHQNHSARMDDLKERHQTLQYENSMLGQTQQLVMERDRLRRALDTLRQRNKHLKEQYQPIDEASLAREKKRLQDERTLLLQENMRYRGKADQMRKLEHLTAENNELRKYNAALRSSDREAARSDALRKATEFMIVDTRNHSGHAELIHQVQGLHHAVETYSHPT